MKKYIKAKKIILSDTIVENSFLEIRSDNTFGEIVNSVNDGFIIDRSAYIIAPGLVDTHIHGYNSYDVMDNDTYGLNEISKGLLSTGVTSWLATTLTDSVENLNNVCTTLGKFIGSEKGAKIQGIFLEGPCFSEKHKGAQNPRYMINPNKDIFDNWCNEANGFIKKIALAPELEGSIEFIKHSTEKGVKVALAHSDATYNQVLDAVDAGANIFVHTFNGMSGLHHREPGMVGGALSIDNVFAEVICDGYHVHPAAIKTVIKCRGTSETVLITDCMRVGGTDITSAKLGEFDVVIKDGTVRLVDNGSLAGSILKLIDGVKNLVTWNLASLEDAIRMASIVPAKSVGIDNICGEIVEGRDADFIIIDDSGNLIETYLNGTLRFSRNQKE